MHRPISRCAIAALAVLTLGGSSQATDIPVHAKSQVIKTDKGAAFVGKLGKIVNKPPKGESYPLPSGDPTVSGGTLRFFEHTAATLSPDVVLPASGWSGLGSPAGSKGWKYKGAGVGSDPCKLVLVKEKVVKAVCRGPLAVDSPSPYSLPIGSFPDSADWELVIGGDRYCARSGAFTGAEIKKNDPFKGIFKAVKAGKPPACPTCDHDVCTPGSPLLAACGSCSADVCAGDPFCCDTAWDSVCIDGAKTVCGECMPPYGSTSRAFVTPAAGLLR